MDIINLEITNFRSFSSSGNRKPLVFRKGINTIVGENNVGKSSILKALDLVTRAYNPSDEDFHKSETDLPISISLKVKLHEEELSQIIAKVLKDEINSQVVKQIVNDMGYIAVYHYLVSVNSSNSPTIDVRFEEMRQKHPGASDPESSRLHSIEEKALPFLLNELALKIKVFAEVRKRPGGKNQRLLESLDGASVADVLYCLKNGNAPQRAKFGLVKSEFKKLFPKLSLEVMNGQDGNPVVMVEKECIKHEVSIERVGAGIGEIITLITNMIASDNMVFGLDAPELHLHPQAQRLLLTMLEEYSKNNQFIIVTHSPIFLDTQKLENVIVARDNEGATCFAQLPDNCFNEEEKQKLQRYLDAFNKEFFFSRSVFVVEGETELGALPIFAGSLNIDFDCSGMSLVRTGKHFLACL